MKAIEFVYTTAVADYSKVIAHLTACDENFFPSLSKKVDIALYADKIIKNAVTFEALEGENLAGLVAAYFNDELLKKGFITNVSTLKKYFGKGIAKKLMYMCIGYAKTKGYEEILLEVSKESEAARNLYTKLNFNAVAETAKIITMTLKL